MSGSYLNIGGGPGFNYPGWVNLDAAATPPFDLAKEAFPLANGSVDLAYSSHCLEHLDDAAVAHVLRETRRVLRPGAPFVVKLPDWAGVLAAWRAGDDAYFRQWGMEAVAHTWDADTITARASMVFCGYWNAAWGDHFKGPGPQGPDPYHGPARIRDEIAAAILEHGSPRSISRILTRIVRATVPDARFNHQNAWGRAEFEFERLVLAQGFRLWPFHGEVVIPGIAAMSAISTYYEFQAV